MCNIKPLAIPLILAFNVLMIGCAMRQRPDVQIKDVSQYKMYQEQKGVRVAVDPYLEEERLIEFFGADLLLSYGLLPVLVVIENSTNQPLLIQKEDIAISTAENGAIAEEPSASARLPIERKIPEVDQAYMSLVSMSFIVPLAVIPSMIAAPFAQKAISDRQTIMTNISAKSLHDKSIYNGEQHHGFVYFLLQDIATKDTSPKVRVKVKNLKTEEIFSFFFDVDLSGVRRQAAEGGNEQ